jgi:hypothetical protein
VHSPGRGWYEAHGADLPVEIAPCATERIRVALTHELRGGAGRIVRRERVDLATDPDRIGALPAGCTAQVAPPTAVAR